jgi:hypothetical protein
VDEQAPARETLRPVEPVREDAWWPRYLRYLETAGFSPTSRKVIGADADYIFESGIRGCDLPGLEWPAGRVRTGVVMGAVQSGKTASMFAVISKALDAGVRAVVVLAGTQVSLWRQTYERLVVEVDGANSREGSERRRSRILRPREGDVGSASEPHEELSILYGVSRAEALRAVDEQRPLIFVAMKEARHLAALRKTLHQAIFPAIAAYDRPVDLLVLDDEADDGSVLDAATETAIDVEMTSLKQTPRHIVDLWATRENPDATAASNLYSTYVGYTATPQANFLQSDQNPLAPRDFVAALRTPYSSGGLTPRETTYLEPAGLMRYYTGAETFYACLAGSGSGPMPLVVERLPGLGAEEDDGEAGRRLWLEESLRSYLVAAAIRLWREPSAPRYGRSDASRRFPNREEAQEATPPIHSMLFHPSAAISDHFFAAAEILRWSHGLDFEAAQEAINRGFRTLNGPAIRRELENESERWSNWLDRFAASAEWVGERFHPACPQVARPEQDWGAIFDLLINDVIPNVKIAIINSDPEADERPRFSPERDESGLWRVPPDTLTVFVAGSVMSRGLTLEGLNTTLFLRSASEVVADTRMQMQRWFGYRGAHLDLCRLFAPARQVSLLRQFHETDEALRTQIIGAMNDETRHAPSPRVIEGRDFKATAKIAGTSKLPLCPSAAPFVNLVNVGASPDPNLQVLADTFRAPSVDVVAHGTLRGRILEEPLSLTAAAGVLESLRYHSYTPDALDPQYARWPSLELQIAADPRERSTFSPLFRAPAAGDAIDGSTQRVVSPRRCPYTIGAYLRLWDACLSRRARGLFPTDQGNVPWSLLDLDARRLQRPRFWVGVRYGSVEPISPKSSGGAPLAALDFQIRPVLRAIVGGRIEATWGSRNPGEADDRYLGDQAFDFHHHGGVAASSAAQTVWRPVGSDGLVLFYVVSTSDVPQPVVAVGVVIPLGGPDHFAALAANGT